MPTNLFQMDLILRYRVKDRNSGKSGDTAKDGVSQTKKSKIVLDGEVGASAHDDTLASDNEDGSVQSGNYSDAEDILDGDVDHVITPPKGDKVDALDSIIAEEYCDEEVAPHLPPIDDKLAVVLTKWLRSLPPRDKIKEMFKHCMIPSNVEGLQQVKINSIVYEKLKGHFKVNDQKLRGINNFIVRGLGPLTSIWDKILKLESALTSSPNGQISHSMGVLQFENMSLDITDMRRQLDRSLKLLSTANCILLDRRRQQLRPTLDSKFHYLLKQNNPITNELLGDNVDQKVSEAIKFSEAAQKLQITPRLFSRQGRFRGRFSNKRQAYTRGHRRPFMRREGRDTGHYNSHNNARGNYSTFRSHRGHGARTNFRFPSYSRSNRN